MLDVFSLALAAGLKMLSKFRHRLGQFLNALILRGYRAHDRRVPSVARHHQRQHGQQLLLQPVGAFTIGFVQDKNVADLHEPGLHALNVIAKPRHEHY